MGFRSTVAMRSNRKTDRRKNKLASNETAAFIALVTRPDITRTIATTNLILSTIVIISVTLIVGTALKKPLITYKTPSSTPRIN